MRNSNRKIKSITRRNQNSIMLNHYFNQPSRKSRQLTLILSCLWISLFASSHREAPLIANDPLADNTDLYAFRSPDNPDMITIIANYIPGELPYGGPNYFSFGKNIRYEIHVDNNVNTPGDDIIYRFTFDQVNEDPSLSSIFDLASKPENYLHDGTEP
jgi:hypothetical protein